MKNVNIVIIRANAYYIVYQLKKAQVFIIFTIKNLKYHTKKKSRIGINSKSIIPIKYYNFINIFFKKDLDIFFTH